MYIRIYHLHMADLSKPRQSGGQHEMGVTNDYVSWLEQHRHSLLKSLNKSTYVKIRKTVAHIELTTPANTHPDATLQVAGANNQHHRHVCF